MRDLVIHKFSKAGDRIVAQSQEMTILSSRNSAARGNQGLGQTASLLFDPNVDFYTVAQSTRLLAAGISINSFRTEYSDVMSNRDTVRLLRGSLYDPTY